MSQDQKIKQNVASSFEDHFDEKGMFVTQTELKSYWIMVF